MPLDTTNGISVWIGKLPPVLIDILNKYEENVEFGTISIQEDKDIENALKFREKRRERLDKPDAINLIFKAFEKNESWSIKDLSDYTGQPMAFVQEIVSEVCELNKEDHRSLYYLKNEYLKRK